MTMLDSSTLTPAQRTPAPVPSTTDTHENCSTLRCSVPPRESLPRGCRDGVKVVSFMQLAAEQACSGTTRTVS